jgi:microcystin-dependent protein
MAEPYLGQIGIFGFNFAPRGYALCDGQLLPINQYQSLYSLLGTNYGGDGKTSFGLPDLRGRTANHVGGSTGLGQKSGQETVSLTMAQMPNHTHPFTASTTQGTQTIPTDNVLAKSVFATYGDFTTATAMNAASTQDQGNGEAHENMQPWLAVNFCIALQGVFPSRN